MVYRRAAISPSPRAVLTTSVIGLAFLPVARFFTMFALATVPAASSLRRLVPRAVLTTSVIGLVFLPVARFFTMFALATVPSASSSRRLVPSSYLIRCEPVQTYHYHLPQIGAGKRSESSQLSYIHGS
jgi:hypothetical protein